MGCGCISIGLHSCTTAPITDRKQLKILPESKLNAQAAQIYEKVKEIILPVSKNKKEIFRISKEIQNIIKAIKEYRQDLQKLLFTPKSKQKRLPKFT